MTLLAAKILLSPFCVVAVSLAGRRWGVASAGVLGALPTVAIAAAFGLAAASALALQAATFLLRSRLLPAPSTP